MQADYSETNSGSEGTSMTWSCENDVNQVARCSTDRLHMSRHRRTECSVEPQPSSPNIPQPPERGHRMPRSPISGSTGGTVLPSTAHSDLHCSSHTHPPAPAHIGYPSVSILKNKLFNGERRRKLPHAENSHPREE